jgi:hypothetical protein
LLRAVLLGSALLASAAGSPARAWTPRTRAAIAWEGARLAPPDLARQIEKHRAAYLEAAEAPSVVGSIAPVGSASAGVDRQLAAEVDAAVAAIQQHRPFEEIVRRLGAVAQLLADANDPLAAAAGGDPDEARYAADYRRYLETAEPRFPLVFYGLPPAVAGARPDAARLAAASLARARSLYPSIGLEYRRIGFASGLGRFDDRSTAFAVGSLSFSHAVTDLASVLRAVWLRAGGADERTGLAPGAGRLFQVLRATQPAGRLAAPAVRIEGAAPGGSGH